MLGHVNAFNKSGGHVLSQGLFHLGDFQLFSGEILRNAQISYETHGKLNADKTNVIVYPTWYAGKHDSNRPAIGTERAMNPEEFFIIVPDMFSNGLSSSPSNSDAPQDGPRFPCIDVYDNVIAQHSLLRHEFGIEEIKLFVGFSMSAQQAFHWSALFPEMVHSMVAICGSAKTSNHNWLFLEGLRMALTADSDFKKGDYESPPMLGLRAFSTVYAGWFASQTFYRQNLHLSFRGNDFRDMNAFLQVVQAMFANHDANDLLGMLNTWQQADISKHPRFNNDFATALSSIRAKAIVMPCATDLYFPPQDSQIEVSHIPNAELRVLPSEMGHLAGLPRMDKLSDVVIEDALKELLV